MPNTAAAITPLLGLLALAACDAEESDPDADNACLPDLDVPIDCTSESDCPTYGCRCEDGSSWLLFGPCSDGACTATTEYECDRQCSSRGGVADAAALPEPTVVGSPECDDWCAKLVAESARLGCGDIERCAPYADCDIAEGECSATARERLACMARSAEFSCDADRGLQIAHDCRASEASCAGDPCLR